MNREGLRTSIFDRTQVMMVTEGISDINVTIICLTILFYLIASILMEQAKLRRADYELHFETCHILTFTRRHAHLLILNFLDVFLIKK